MKAAPLQLLQAMFRKVCVELDEAHAPNEPPNPITSIFMFDDVEIATEFGMTELEPDAERGRLFLVSLRVMVDNQPRKDVPELKFSPYLIDVELRGVVLIPTEAEKLAPAEKLASVNGASLLWSSIREQVVSMTSRMPAGPVMLPTMNFHDLKNETPTVEAAPAPVAKPRVRRNPAVPPEKA